jgi:hypothetical protein
VAANIYMKSVSLTAEWAKLSDEPVVVNATVIASARNYNEIDMRVNGGPIVKWPAGASAKLEGVDLSQIEVKGGVGHLVLVVGHTR